jgi:hypothetical protein
LAEKVRGSFERFLVDGNQEKEERRVGGEPKTEVLD